MRERHNLIIYPVDNSRDGERNPVRIVLPVINLGGTSRERLVEDRMNIIDSLKSALGDLQELEVHGRDYMMIGPDYYQEARDQHQRRLQTLKSLIFEMEQEAIAINEDDFMGHGSQIGRAK